MFIEQHTKLNYRILFSSITFWDNDNLTLHVQVAPNFIGYNPSIENECVVLDVLELIDTLSTDGKGYLLTCECGYAEDSDILSPLTKNSDDKYIYWDLDIKSYRTILSHPLSKRESGTLRLIFDKNEYRDSIIEMMSELQKIIREGIAASSLSKKNLTNTYGLKDNFHNIIKNYPHITHLPVENINPYDL
ncbi:hypothetical protein [Testudinibacter sp. TR-2022]|uniref:hypothetical protein n=1 Tax=Testudinibacter sp. TR-2022 TaxID=2585029 RepID=UPI00111BAFD6|nr:hypothetical protein [Testudinibacter sp. TR-2022]TNH22793.1 hypothetical protein FHQ29_06800 [Testudinibacter sp. TR-2022]TNH26389.1 hypothetical protein FHQ27_07580 [Testudinibacter sp. TR-2022]